MARRRAAHLREVLYGLRVSPEGSCVGRVVLRAIVRRWNLLGGAVYEALWPTGVLQTFKKSESPSPSGFLCQDAPGSSRFPTFATCYLSRRGEGSKNQQCFVWNFGCWNCELNRALFFVSSLLLRQGYVR